MPRFKVEIDYFGLWSVMDVVSGRHWPGLYKWQAERLLDQLEKTPTKWPAGGGGADRAAASEWTPAG